MHVHLGVLGFPLCYIGQDFPHSQSLCCPPPHVLSTSGYVPSLIRCRPDPSLILLNRRLSYRGLGRSGRSARPRKSSSGTSRPAVEPYFLFSFAFFLAFWCCALLLLDDALPCVARLFSLFRSELSKRLEALKKVSLNQAAGGGDVEQVV